MKLKRSHFEKLYEKYPDVVDLKQFREISGGNADIAARNPTLGDYVEHFVVNGTYMLKNCSLVG